MEGLHGRIRGFGSKGSHPLCLIALHRFHGHGLRGGCGRKRTGFRSEGMNHLRLIDRWAHQMRFEFFRSEGMDHLRLIVSPLIGRSGLGSCGGKRTGFRSEGMNHLRLIDRWAHQMRFEFFRSEGMDHLRLIVSPLIGRSGWFGSYSRQENGFSKRRDGPPPSNRPLGAPGHWWLRQKAQSFIKHRGLPTPSESIVSLMVRVGRGYCSRWAEWYGRGGFT